MKTNKPSVGFVGLGIMGMAMARHTRKAGYPVVVTSRSEEKRASAKRDGLLTVATPKDVAEASQVIITMVTDPKAVQDVLMGPDGVFEAAIKNKTLLQTSTLDVKSTLHFARDAEEHGMKFLDCPVAGSKAQVEGAQLIFLVGGDTALVEKWHDLLMVMGKSIVHAGGVGKGTALKLCMNLIVAQMTTALCESMALAKALDVAPHKILDVISESPALNCGYFKIKGKSLLEQDFSPAFSLSNMLKDVRFIDQAAKEQRIYMPVTQAVRVLMENALHEGLGNQDLSVIAKTIFPKSRP